MTAPGSFPLPCGIAVPQVFVDEPVDMGLVREFSRRAEALGYHSLWTQEQIIGSTPVLEPIYPDSPPREEEDLVGARREGG